MTASVLPSISIPPEQDAVTTTPAQQLDIVENYRTLLASDPLLTPPIAAIESLISLLSATPPSTVSETLSILSTASSNLKANVSNPLPVTAGTDLFQRYIISTLQSRSASSSKKILARSGAGDDFQAVRTHLLANSRLFVQRAKESRGVIAERAAGFISEGVTVITLGASRVVGAVLDRAAAERKRFRVIYVESSVTIKKAQTSSIVKGLWQKGVPVAVIPFENLATAMARATLALTGAESIVENGGAVSRMGTYQMALLAEKAGKPFYVVAESYKFVRIYPLDEQDVRIRGQADLDFRTGENAGEGSEKGQSDEMEEMVDFTPPDLVTALVTEAGVQTPSAVSEELIKIWD